MGGVALDTCSYIGFSKKRELIRIERLKIVFQFLLMTVFSFVVGCLIASSLSADFYESSVVGVSSHFEKLFINCATVYDHAKCVLIYSFGDVLCIAMIFLVSFSAFNYIATDLVLIYCGIRCGLSICFLSAFIGGADYLYSIGIIRYIVFVFFKTAIMLLLLCYAYTAAVSSSALRRTVPNGRIVISPQAAAKFLLYTLACMGSVLMLSGLSCWFMYLLK